MRRLITVIAELDRICYAVSLVTNTRYNSELFLICQGIWEIVSSKGPGVS